MIVAKFLSALCKIAFMELNPSLMVLDQDVNDQERGTIVDREKRVGAINPEVEIVMMIIIEREAENERDTGTEIGTETESVTESASIVIVRRWVFLVLVVFSVCIINGNYNSEAIVYTVYTYILNGPTTCSEFNLLEPSETNDG